MQREGRVLNAITYLSIMNPSASNAHALKWMKEVHVQACKAGLQMDVRIANVLVYIYTKIGSIRDAEEVFNRMLTYDVIS